MAAPASSTVRNAYIGNTWRMPIFMCALMATARYNADGRARNHTSRAGNLRRTIAHTDISSNTRNGTVDLITIATGK